MRDGREIYRRVMRKREQRKRRKEEREKREEREMRERDERERRGERSEMRKEQGPAERLLKITEKNAFQADCLKLI